MKQSETKSLGKNIGTIPKNMLTNFELKQLKRKLDIVKKPENRVHELTDSNVSHGKHPPTRAFFVSLSFCFCVSLDCISGVNILVGVTGKG